MLDNETPTNRPQTGPPGLWIYPFNVLRCVDPRLGLLRLKDHELSSMVEQSGREIQYQFNFIRRGKSANILSQSHDPFCQLHINPRK